MKGFDEAWEKLMKHRNRPTKDAVRSEIWNAAYFEATERADKHIEELEQEIERTEMELECCNQALEWTTELYLQGATKRTLQFVDAMKRISDLEGALAYLDIDRLALHQSVSRLNAAVVDEALNLKDTLDSMTKTIINLREGKLWEDSDEGL